MDAEELLRRLGVSGKLRGFHYAIYMMERVMEDPTAILLITKCLYIETARHFRVSYDTVERNVRTMVQKCWCRGDRAFLEKVAGKHIAQKPTNSEFLDMTAAFLRRQGRG